MESLDLIIIGAGPAGLSCAIEAHKAKLNYKVLEKGMLANSIYHFPTNMTFFSTSKLLEIGEVPFISHSDKPTRREALEYYRRVVESYDLKVRFYESVDRILPKEPGFQLTTRKAEYFTKYIIVATGFFDKPRMLDVPGEDLPKVKHYYDEAHPYVGQKLLVVGGANSACDVALETWHKGAEVTMAIREDSIYKGVKYWIRPNIENRIKERSIKAYFNTEVVRIGENNVTLAKAGKTIELENDFVLAMTGYQPDYSQFEKWNIPLKEGPDRVPVQDEASLESGLKDMYLAGVINAGMKTSKLFIENTRHHGKKIIRDILKKLARN